MKVWLGGAFITYGLGAAFALSAWSQESKAPVLPKTDDSARRNLTDEEINAQFFKRAPAQEKQEIFLPVFYEGMDKAIDRIRAQVVRNSPSSPMSAEVDGRALMRILSELVVESWLGQVPFTEKECSNEVCLIPVQKFGDDKVLVVFDERSLEIKIRVTPELRSPKTSALFNYDQNSNLDETNSPSGFSSFLNMNLSQMLRSNDPTYKAGRQPLLGQFLSGTRIGPVVIEGNGRYVERRTEAPTNEPAFQRDDVRAIVDFPISRLRAQAGDLVYPVRGFQNYRPMAGVTLFSQFGLQPSQLTLPTGNYQVYLSRPSKVMVFINEQLIQVLDLPAGTHNLRDFPFNGGLNDLRLEILDDLGRSETRSYQYFSNNELLKPGLSEISYSYGAPWTFLDGNRIYDSKNGTVSVFHRHGFSQNLTLGANFQRDQFQTVAGVEALTSTPIGYMSVEPAYSINQGTPAGYAARFRYILQSLAGQKRTNRLTSVELNLFSPYFVQLGLRDRRIPAVARILINHNRMVTDKTGINMSLGYQVSRKVGLAAYDTYNFTLGVTHRWLNGLSTNVNIRHERSALGSEDISLSAFLIWTFPKERQYVTASHNTTSNASRADWTYQSRQGVDGYTVQGNVQKTASGNGYGGLFDYIGNRSRIGATQQVELQDPDPNQAGLAQRKTRSSTNIRFGTALVFAGGHFAVSRPVTDSFAMLVPRKNLHGQNIRVNPVSDGSFIAETDWMGPAVHPEIPSYNFTELRLGLDELKANTSIPKDHFLIKPPFHGGYAIPIGSDATVYLKAILVNPDNTPASMIAGQAYYLDDTSVEAVTIFTNREGLIRSEGFRAGRYRLELNEGNYSPIEFEIPESATEEFDLKTIQLKAKQ